MDDDDKKLSSDELSEETALDEEAILGEVEVDDLETLDEEDGLTKALNPLDDDEDEESDRMWGMA